MKLTKKIHRLFSMFMAISVAVSITLPSGLLTAHCDMETQQSSKSEMIAGHCPYMKVSSSHANHRHQNEDDCNWTLNCACDLDQQQITAEAIPTITKTAKVFVVPVTQFINIEPTKTPTFFTDAVLDQHTETPPIFLLNSVFLN